MAESVSVESGSDQLTVYGDVNASYYVMDGGNLNDIFVQLEFPVHLMIITCAILYLVYEFDQHHGEIQDFIPTGLLAML